ncbi:putative N-acetylated-alpha-linked acidic dipeptidase [Amphiura filiformis]|uniref:putative N-acetylated-alpha-linked acidic dipeptidase n=1 Tax=Amphiura filiformis TaxID=82378 RepID=UPI003B215E12
MGTAAATKKRPFILLGILCLIIGFVIGILIGFLSSSRGGGQNGERAEDNTISDKLLAAIDKEQIRENLRYLTSKPHVAGTPVSKEQAEWVRDKFLENGCDDAEIVQYKLLLSYPSEEAGKENRVQLLAADGSVLHESQLVEANLDPEVDVSEMLPPFSAYSAAGEVEGDLVYANYARIEDFEHLKNNHSIDVRDKIIIARFGAIYRGDKAKNAGLYGAKGIILYSDPYDFAIEGEAVYPDGPHLPGTGTQRGSTMFKFGDPQTPGYPALETAYRIPEENLTVLPIVPVHPIGYDDAKEFLKLMAGEEVESKWRGRIENITYRYGPGFAGADANKRVAMRIYTHNQEAYGWNVIGTIRGEIEPDRYVMMGNHRDAWGFGAVDASGGTAAMVEITRAFGKMMKRGWRPRRTLKFCSWGAEEFGLIGSNEWVEEFSKNLNERAVAYFNMDIIQMGTHVVAISDTPNLSNAVYAAARKVKDPSPSGNRQTVYDTWVERSLKGTNDDGTPVIGTLGSGSDYAPFVQLVGVSALDFSYRHDKKAHPNIALYPAYHSVYDTFRLVEKFYDPEFKYHLAGAQLFAELLRDFSDSAMLPMDCPYYAESVQGYVKSFKEGDIGARMIQEGLSLDGMQEAADKLTQAAKEFKQRLGAVDTKNTLQVRQINDQMMKLDRAFIDPLGLPGRPFVRHVLFAPSSKNAYASDKFAGIADAMFDIDNNLDANKWETVKQQLAAVTFAIQSAASTLVAPA